MIAKKSIDKAASLFNAYNKKLGLADSVHEKYIGTIFTRQQSNFIESLELPFQNRETKTDKRSKKVNLENVELKLRGLKAVDFDRSIKFGRDDKLWLKREAIERLSATTRYSEDELQNLKTVYTSFA